MKFSILIAQYNNGKYFKDCWDSIQNQSYQNYEVIIVDDASTDDSVQIINNIIADDSRVKIYKNEKNKGCGYTKHRCATLATGDICAYLDPDDTLEPDALALMVETHHNNPNAAIVSSKYYLVDEHLSNKIKSKQGALIPADSDYLHFGKGVITAFASFKRNVYGNTSGINPKFKRAVDQDLYYKLEEQGNQLFIDKYLYNYRINSSSISCNDNEYKATYWHIEAMKDAVNRRGLNSDDIFVYRLMQKEFEYIKQRMIRATKNNKYCARYYFVFRLFAINFKYQLRYKIYALINPFYVHE